MKSRTSERFPRAYTRGGPVSFKEATRLRDSQFVWKTADGLFFPLDNIEDDHLLNIELHHMGRSSYALDNPKFQVGTERWERSYKTIRDEIDRRGLTLKETTGAEMDATTENFIRR